MDVESAGIVNAQFDQSSVMREINERLVISSLHNLEKAESATLAEQRLRDIVYGLDAVICEVDTATGRPTFLSLRTEIFLGHSIDYWQAQDNFLAAIIHPDDHERATALFPLFERDAHEYRYDFRAKSVSENPLWLRNIVRPVEMTTQNSLLLRCVIVDVTAEIQTAEALEEAYARERNIADTLQRSILFMPPENSYPGLAVDRLYEAASDDALVGGDFSDTFACHQGCVAMILGDVMGHGLPAAMLTAELKYTLRGFVREHQQPSRVMQQMNSYLCESYRLYREGLNEQANDNPLCLAIAIINTTTGKGLVSAAGMEPPLLIRKDGRAEALDVGGLLLGVVLGQKYEEMAFGLDKGDSLILVTDGVTETRDAGSFLGYDGLCQLAIEGRASKTLNGMGRIILDGSRTYAGGRFKDDACILLARRE